MRGLSNLRKTLIFVVSLVAVSSAAARVDSPATVIEGFHASLLEVMREAETLGVRGRYDRLAPHIEEAFNLSLMIRIASGSFWRKASAPQREQLVAAFKNISVGTYAHRFDGYSGQVFELVAEKPGPRGTHLVETRIVSPGESPVSLTYVTLNFQGRWRIVDVLLENGISELAVRRSEYRRVLKSDGVEGLIAVLNDKADKLIRP